MSQIFKSEMCLLILRARQVKVIFFSYVGYCAIYVLLGPPPPHHTSAPSCSMNGYWLNWLIASLLCL